MSSDSFGIAVFTSAPQLPGNDGSIWYYGNHPHPADHPLGVFCHLRDSHRHDYAPYRGHRYAFHDGHYFWVGDAKPYALRDHSYAFYGHHPHPHYFGGYCRIRGLHQHGYAPGSADYYRLKSGAYFFTGIYGRDYYEQRDRYDARGWRHDHRDRGYREHERAQQVEPTDAPTHESRPSHSHTGVQSIRDKSVESGATERRNAHRATSRELVERMRARVRNASRRAPANAAAE